MFNAREVSRLGLSTLKREILECKNRVGNKCPRGTRVTSLLILRWLLIQPSDHDHALPCRESK